MVFQSFNLFNNMNVLENCLSGQLTVLKRNRQEAKEIALENLKKLEWSVMSTPNLLNFLVDKNNG